VYLQTQSSLQPPTGQRHWCRKLRFKHCHEPVEIGELFLESGAQGLAHAATALLAALH
jgi:hypothetical protein